MARKKVVCIALPENVLDAIDKVRGPISRSSFILWLIEESLRDAELRLAEKKSKLGLRTVKTGTKKLVKT